MFSISELACASSNGSVLINIAGFGISDAACLSSANAARERMHCFKMLRVSNAAVGGNSGRLLYG